jgi:hypothetical protein
VALAILLAVIWFAQREEKGLRPLKNMSVEWTIASIWEAPRPLSPQQPQEGNPHGLEIFLDVSIPVGGFLPPPTTEREFSGFRGMVNQIPDHMVSVAGQTDSPVRWFGISEAVRALADKPDPLKQDLFNGRETRLDLALRQILLELDKGDVDMAALVSDLIATDELIGAMGAAKALSDWGQSSRVRSGEFGVGILGARASYWGVHQEKCGTSRDIGCWFSEQAQEYRPLTGLAKRPFYILILGRGLDNVDRVGKALLEGARDLKLEAHWELLSGASRSRKSSVDCSAWKADEPDQDQFALLRDEAGLFQCQRSESVELVCSIPPGVQAKALGARSSWEAVQTRLREEKLVLTIDCERLRSAPPPTDLVVTIEGEPLGGWADVWKKWSAETDEREEDIDRTLRIEAFVEKVWLRPDRIRMTSEPILKARAR